MQLFYKNWNRLLKICYRIINIKKCFKKLNERIITYSIINEYIKNIRLFNVSLRITKYNLWSNWRIL